MVGQTQRLSKFFFCVSAQNTGSHAYAEPPRVRNTVEVCLREPTQQQAPTRSRAYTDFSRALLSSRNNKLCQVEHAYANLPSQDFLAQPTAYANRLPRQNCLTCIRNRTEEVPPEYSANASHKTKSRSAGNTHSFGDLNSFGFSLISWFWSALKAHQKGNAVKRLLMFIPLSPKRGINPL